MKCFSPFEGTLVLKLDFFFSDQHPGVSQPHYVLKKKLKKKKSALLISANLMLQQWEVI